MKGTLFTICKVVSKCAFHFDKLEVAYALCLLTTDIQKMICGSQ